MILRAYTVISQLTAAPHYGKPYANLLCSAVAAHQNPAGPCKLSMPCLSRYSIAPVPYHPTKIQGSPCVCMGRLSTAQLAPHYQNQALPSSGLPCLMKCPRVKTITKFLRAPRAPDPLAGPSCPAFSSPKSQPAHIEQQARQRDATLNASASSARVTARSCQAASFAAQYKPETDGCPG